MGLRLCKIFCGIEARRCHSLFLSLSQFLSAPDIGTLGALVTSAKQDHQYLAFLVKIDAIAGAMINPHLGDAATDRLAVSKVASFGPSNAGSNTRLCSRISQTKEPFLEFVGLPDFEHGEMYLKRYRFAREKSATWLLPGSRTARLD
ncbi:hypothetical protein BRADO5247 [Bradyrhizobium sp. ORS 278]|nr:hypothetical protein BRADO5247 [Bradyrhizobium sp. ORS 278]